jgi:hypothetical protein
MQLTLFDVVLSLYVKAAMASGQSHCGYDIRYGENIITRIWATYGLVPTCSVGTSGYNFQYKWDVVSIGIHVSSLKRIVIKFRNEIFNHSLSLSPSVSNYQLLHPTQIPLSSMRTNRRICSRCQRNE